MVSLSPWKAVRALRLVVSRVVDADETMRRRLFHLSDAMSREKSFEAWNEHFDTNEIVHAFTETSHGTCVGFQLWRWSEHLSAPKEKTQILWGGKLRIAPEMRGYGLNLVMNLVALHDGHTEVGDDEQMQKNEQKEKKEDDISTKVYRVGLVNVHGFSTLFDAIPGLRVAPFDGDDEMKMRVAPVLNEMVRANGFTLGSRAGRVDVGQRSPYSPDEFDESWWARPGVEAFRIASPGAALTREETLSRENDVFCCFEATDSNLEHMRIAAEKKLHRAAHKSSFPHRTPHTSTTIPGS